jgi:hypothetical protein
MTLSNYGRWIAAVLLIATTLAIGVMIGMASEINFRIDVCSDATSGRYIEDGRIRERVCF